MDCAQFSKTSSFRKRAESHSPGEFSYLASRDGVTGRMNTCHPERSTNASDRGSSRISLRHSPEQSIVGSLCRKSCIRRSESTPSQLRQSTVPTLFFSSHRNTTLAASSYAKNTTYAQDTRLTPPSPSPSSLSLAWSPRVASQTAAYTSPLSRGFVPNFTACSSVLRGENASVSDSQEPHCGDSSLLSKSPRKVAQEASSLSSTGRPSSLSPSGWRGSESWRGTDAGGTSFALHTMSQDVQRHDSGAQNIPRVQSPPRPSPPHSRAQKELNAMPAALRGSPVPRSSPPAPHITAAQDSQFHKRKLEGIATYLKNHYACEPAESQHGLETLHPDDLAALIRCFYKDVYQLVRERRRRLRVDLGSFAAEDPSLTGLDFDQWSDNPSPSSSYESSRTPPRKSTQKAGAGQSCGPGAAPVSPKTAGEDTEKMNDPAAKAQSREGASGEQPSKGLSKKLPSAHTSCGGASLQEMEADVPRRSAPPLQKASLDRPLAYTAPPPATAHAPSGPPPLPLPHLHALPCTPSPQPPPTPSLKTLLLPLRKGSFLVKHIGWYRAPHIRFFVVYDRVSVLGGRELLVPHLAWRPKNQAQNSSVDWADEEADGAHTLSLAYLEAVNEGFELEPRIFKRRGGHVVDHCGHTVPKSMCAVLLFRSRTLGLSFLNARDRQNWMTALTAIVEYNQTHRV